MIWAALTDDSGTVVEASSYYTERPSTVLGDLVGWVGDGPGVRVEQTPRLGDGVLSGRVRREGRSVTISATSLLTDRADVWDWERMIAGLFGGDGTRVGTLRVVQDDVFDLEATVQLAGPAKIATNVDNISCEWQLPLFCPDPRLYGQPQTVQLVPEGNGAGLEYPLHNGPGGGLVYDGATGQQATLLYNPGTADARPTFTVVGDFASGFRLTVGDAVIEYPFATFPASPVTVDMSGHLWIGAQDVQAVLTSRQWATVPAGSAVVARFEPIQANGSGFCNATIRPTYY